MAVGFTQAGRSSLGVGVVSAAQYVLGVRTGIIFGKISLVIDIFHHVIENQMAV